MDERHDHAHEHPDMCHDQTPDTTTVNGAAPIAEVLRQDQECTEQDHVGGKTRDSTTDSTDPSIDSQGDQPTVTITKTTGDQGGSPQDTLDVHVQNYEPRTSTPIHHIPDPLPDFNTDCLKILPTPTISIHADPEESTGAELGTRSDTCIDKSAISLLGPPGSPCPFNSFAPKLNHHPSLGDSLAALKIPLEEIARDPFFENTPPRAPSRRMFNSPHEGPTPKTSRLFLGAGTNISPSGLQPILRDEVRELSERIINLETLIREDQEQRSRSVRDYMHCIIQEGREERDKELVNSIQKQVAGHIKKIAEAYVQRHIELQSLPCTRCRNACLSFKR
jgi:hypothetical protein